MNLDTDVSQLLFVKQIQLSELTVVNATKRHNNLKLVRGGGKLLVPSDLHRNHLQPLDIGLDNSLQPST